MMKFAFSAAACPQWDLETLAGRARELGYEGVELIVGSSTASSNDPELTDPSKIIDIFQSANVKVACLSADVALMQEPKADAATAGRIVRWIELASLLQCPVVKISDVYIKPRQSRSAAGLALGEWLARLGDSAAEKKVMLGVGNAISFRTARVLWTVLEPLGHRSVGTAWDVHSAAEAGESPWVSVPMLNSRIIYAIVKEGRADVRGFVQRLRGIGYEGWVTVHAPPDQLADSLTRLREWGGVGQ
ncbi:MAG: sugar phosphate isomerase/epimerase [Phycisphaerales bacterium]|jgi:sugar phosphate isomerase/epimerase|nr:sugar phosphate isomerase/epimerase [Phycisphaerales bacterium]